MSEVRAYGVMRIGDGFRAGAAACVLLAGLLLAACGKKEKEAPAPEVRPPSVSAVFQQGVEHLRRGDLDPAVQAFSLIVAKAYAGAPERPQAYFYLGLIAYRGGKMDLAVQNFNAALKLNPDIPQARLSLGNAHFAAGRLDEAIAAWEQLAKERPNLASVHNNLGIAYLDSGNVDKAIEHLEQTVSLSPDNYRAQRNLATAYHKKGMSAEAEAAERKARAIQSRMLVGRPPEGPGAAPQDGSGDGSGAALEAVPSAAAPATP